jgi:tetratricopeptide (TPR) repeat protein
MAEAMNHAVGACPDLESIAAYLDGRVTDRERARITEHLAACEDCYFVFSEAAQTHVSPAPKRATGPRSRFAQLATPKVAWSSAGAALATAACVWLLVGSGVMRPRSASPELRALVAAVGNERTIEARLSGGFAYGPLRGAVRAGAPAPRAISPDLRIAAARSEKALVANRTAQALHALGVASLLMGEIDRAVPLLEQAVDQPSPDARMLSDLSAAYLARAARDNRQQDVAKALAAADRTVAIDRILPEALFNRAVALERLSLVAEARAAWNGYLKIDDQSGWAAEARSHLSALR